MQRVDNPAETLAWRRRTRTLPCTQCGVNGTEHQLETSFSRDLRCSRANHHSHKRRQHHLRVVTSQHASDALLLSGVPDVSRWCLEVGWWQRNKVTLNA